MNLIKGVLLFFVYLFIDNTLLSKDTIYYNKMYNIKSNVCNNIYLNISPIINKSYLNMLPFTNNSHNIKKNNYMIKDCQRIWILKKEISVKYLFIYIYNKLLIFLGNALIIFLFIKNQEIKNKMLLLNQITKRVNYETTFDNCSICYSNYKFYSRIRKIIKCPHIYHEDCIKQWLIEYNNKTCPLCRCDVF
jgi:hypothetical protein